MRIHAIQVYVSYSRKDQQLWKELKNHLIPLERKGLIALYDPNDQIGNVGREWQQAISSHLESAQLILLLISPYYIASEFLYNIEMKRAMQRCEVGEATVLPILLRPTYWQDEPFGTISPSPENHRPVTMWRKKGAAFLQVAIEIRKIVDQLLASPDTKIVNVWISERLNLPGEPLFAGETYTLNINMKQPGSFTSSIESEEGTKQPGSMQEGLDTSYNQNCNDLK